MSEEHSVSAEHPLTIELPTEEQMSEAYRTRLIGEIVAAVRAPDVPCEARKAALELVSWLARRMPWDDAPCDFRRQRKG